MTKGKALAVLFLLVVLTLCADDRKRNVVQHNPDSLPASLSADTILSGSSEDVDCPMAEYVVESAPSGVRYSLDAVAEGDSAVWKRVLCHKLDSLSSIAIFETSQLGLYVYDITAGEDLFAVNHRQRMRPASCEKLVTAVTALDCLGGDYQFLTDLLVTGAVNDGVLDGDVYVVGRMDPLLAGDDVDTMAKELRAWGIKHIKGSLYVDISFKDADEYGWGWCWDDRWGPLRVLTVDGQDVFSRQFLSSLSSVGITVADTSMAVSVCPPSARLLYQVRHTIDQILLKMMKHSDNIFAESLFYHIAALGGQRGTGRKEATACINSFISSRLGLDPSAYQIADGSGLSLYNYVSPQLLVKMLTYAWQSERIRPHLYYSLPVAGSDGTLKGRMRGTLAENNVRAKTGTVDGISSLSGYAINAGGHILVFSIINQGISSASVAKRFQDEVCQLLCR